MEILKSVFLGIVQGLTEFLPVSSSAHLNVFPWLFGWQMEESFDFALHAGTLLALLVYFFKDWISLIKGGIFAVVKKERSTEGRLFWFIVIATIPAGLVGKLLESIVDSLFEDNMNGEMIIISLALIIVGIIMYIVDRNAKQTVSLEKMNFKKSFFIGLSQAVAAAVPGVSRSGATITVARAYGLDRESAARYSFLLSAPIVGGGMIVSLGKFSLDAAFFAGIISSFLVGLLVIKFFMGFIKKRSYGGFAIYRIIAGMAIFLIAAIRIAVM